MARTYKIKTIAIPLELWEGLLKKKAHERRYGSFNAYVCDILDEALRQSSDGAKEPKTIYATRVRNPSAKKADEQQHRKAG